MGSSDDDSGLMPVGRQRRSSDEDPEYKPGPEEEEGDAGEGGGGWALGMEESAYKAAAGRGGARHARGQADTADAAAGTAGTAEAGEAAGSSQVGIPFFPFVRCSFSTHACTWDTLAGRPS